MIRRAQANNGQRCAAGLLRRRTVRSEDDASVTNRNRLFSPTSTIFADPCHVNDVKDDEGQKAPVPCVDHAHPRIASQ